jgi:hypothetical protein
MDLRHRQKAGRLISTVQGASVRLSLSPLNLQLHANRALRYLQRIRRVLSPDQSRNLTSGTLIGACSVTALIRR